MIDDGNGDDIDDEDETIPMALCGIMNPRSIIPILLCKQRSLQHHARNKITKEISWRGVLQVDVMPTTDSTWNSQDLKISIIWCNQNTQYYSDTS